MPETEESKAERRSLQQLVREAWMSALGVFTTAEGELQKASTRLLEALGVSLDAEGGRHLAADWIARVRKNREEFERKIDEGVRASIARVRAPIEKEIALIKSRIERMDEKLDLRKAKRAEKNRGPKGS